MKRKKTKDKWGAQKLNNVCLKHRTSGKGSNVTCPICQETMTCIGIRYRIPKKQKDSDWKKLESLFAYSQAKKNKK